MSDAKALDTHEQLRLLLKQQRCLGQQLATLSQLQQPVIQHLITGTSTQSATTVTSPSVTQPQSAEPVISAHATSPFTAMNAVTGPGTAAGQMADENSAGTAVEDVSPTPDATVSPNPASSHALTPTPAANSPIGGPSALHEVGAVPAAVAPAASALNSRSARYLQPNPPAAAKRVTSQDVNRVARLYEVGEAAHLVLQFGEYRGASLIQVAQVDPDYVRSLALTAQRPQVRAAASAMVRALEASERTATRRRPGNSHTSRIRP
jgi:hypothetical protein